MADQPTSHPLRGPAQLAVAILVIGALLLAIAMLVVVIAFVRLIQSADQGPTLADIHSEFTDQSIDAGYEEPTLLADDPLLATRKIVLGHDVNARSAKDVIARLLYLDSLDANEPIDLYLTTLGGWGDNAFSIIDTMQMIDAPVNTHAVGVCYSSGAMILVAGTGRRTATQNAIIMVHANSIDDDTKYSYDGLETDRYHRLWREHASLPDEWYPMTNDDKEYYLDAEQSRELNIVDEILPTKTSQQRDAQRPLEAVLEGATEF